MSVPIYRRVAAFWGVAGVLLILGQACWRLGWEARHAFEMSWSVWHGVVFVLILVFMAYSEGYRAFQKQFSPRVVSRARTLLMECTGWRGILAPLFCMGFFHATRKRMVVTYVVTAGVIGLIVLVRSMPHPWRGMIDCGVVVGLGWGMVAILCFVWKAWRDPTWSYPPDLPSGD
ncbi:MAG: hypothetical protein ACFCUX_08965 [Candidatus Methylacidiphilales bacterium]